MRGRLMIFLTAVLVAAVTVACGVVGNGAVDRVNPPAGLDQTIPTTSTAPPTTMAATSTSGLQTTTTQVQTEQVRLYFIASGQLVQVTNALPAPASLAQIMAALQDGPPEGQLGKGLRSAVPPATGPDSEIRATNNNAGVAVVELPKGFFDSIAVPDQRLVIAQIVLTLTDSRGIGQVQFNRTVPLPSGEPAPDGTLLTKADFQSLLDSSTGANGPGGTQTSTSQPATTPADTPVPTT
jgi:hypothetical protein